MTLKTMGGFKMNKKFFIIVGLILALSLTVGAALAEDGLIFRKNVTKTPDAETEKAGLFLMDFYVPAQSSAGLVGPVDNYQLLDGTDALDYPDRNYAKPLVGVFIDDIGGDATNIGFNEEESVQAVTGGISFGHFDAFAAVSLDDGTSWKTTNLSKSQDLTSFNLADGSAYPGDVHNVVHQVFNDNIMVVWVSKYCEGGSPLYSLDPADTEVAAYLADLEGTYGKDAVYLYDLFGIAGSQSSVNYEEQGWPEIGEIPFSCVWTARGKLVAGDDPATTEAEATYVVWTKAERLTSGTRDANLPAVDCAAGAGCMLTWQEDPEGLRPGQGLGPGEGWSGAVAWQQTDIWYSHIAEADFDLVWADEETVGAITIEDFVALDDPEATMPKAYVPMAAPVRLTDNAMCKSDTAKNEDPYCFIDFDTIDTWDVTNVVANLEDLEQSADSDFCTETVSYTNPGGTTLNVCVTEDGRLLNGRVASTRVRLNLKPYTTAVDLNSDSVLDKSAWIIMASEESKALGAPDSDDEDVDPIDIGKDMWYYSFDPFKTGAEHAMVLQGGQLNQPAVCSEHDIAQGATCTVDEFFPVQTTSYTEDGPLYEFYLTEIARRFALTTNSSKAIVDSESGLAAMLIFKQGIINQGGPADIMLRRVVVPDDFDPTVDNPYAYENMECDEWAYDDGSNPLYLQGLCLSPAINISATTIVECTGATGNDNCAATFPANDDGSIESEADFPKVLEWRQCDGVAGIDGCEDDSDLDDQSWDNPFDISKGHRGFLDGDFVMMMYAWSPNWKSNSVGNDHYNLYVRRSFDGGLTWTTTPGEFGGAGLIATENYCVSTSSDLCVGTEFTYAAGAFEQGRNVSQLIGNKITILDPRYSPTGGLKLYPTIQTWFLTEYADLLPEFADVLPYEDDAERDRSKFFMIYETGDNTTSDVGEATPLNLYYSRATVYGDEWELDPDYITVAEDGTITIEDHRWNWAEVDHEILSGEAAMLANPGGTFMYAVWNQWEEHIGEDGHEVVFNSDMPFRRFLYLPDDTTVEIAPIVEFIYTGPVIYSWLDEDVATFYISARDIDKVGDPDAVLEYSWKVVSTDGREVMLEDCTGKTCNVPMRTLLGNWGDWGSKNPGAWSAGVKVKDNDGSSREVFSPEFVIYYDIHTLSLPVMFR
jgi:hypothetical protein